MIPPRIRLYAPLIAKDFVSFYVRKATGSRLKNTISHNKEIDSRIFIASIKSFTTENLLKKEDKILPVHLFRGLGVAKIWREGLFFFNKCNKEQIAAIRTCMKSHLAIGDISYDYL